MNTQGVAIRVEQLTTSTHGIQHLLWPRVILDFSVVLNTVEDVVVEDVVDTVVDVVVVPVEVVDVVIEELFEPVDFLTLVSNKGISDFTL